MARIHAKLFHGVRVKTLARNFLAAVAAIFLIAPLQVNAKVLWRAINPFGESILLTDRFYSRCAEGELMAIAFHTTNPSDPQVWCWSIKSSNVILQSPFTGELRTFALSAFK